MTAFRSKLIINLKTRLNTPKNQISSCPDQQALLDKVTELLEKCNLIQSELYKFKFHDASTSTNNAVLDILMPAIHSTKIKKKKTNQAYVPSRLSPKQIPLHPNNDFMYIEDDSLCQDPSTPVQKPTICLDDIHFVLPNFSTDETKIIEDFCTLQRLYFLP